MTQKVRRRSALHSPADLGSQRGRYSRAFFRKIIISATYSEKVTHSAPISMSMALTIVVSARQNIPLFQDPISSNVCPFMNMLKLV